MRIKNEETVNINGLDYWTIAQFAFLVGISTSYVRVLISYGNKIRKLKVEHFGSKPFIPAEEVFDYPFMSGGRPSIDGRVVKRFQMEGDDLVAIESRYEE